MDEPGGEATQIAWAPPRAASWSRDGRLAVWADADSAAGPRGARTDSTAPDPFARTPMARPPFGAITRPLDPRRFDGRHVVDFPYKSNDRGFVPNRRARCAYPFTAPGIATARPPSSDGRGPLSGAPDRLAPGLREATPARFAFDATVATSSRFRI